MKLTGFCHVGSGLFSRKQLLIAPALALLCALVTGCPHNEYTVELKPQGDALERTLTFYRADGTDSNGAPKYLEFPSNELASITRLYPAGAVRREGEQFKAAGKFSGAMPGDIGGNGNFSRLRTSLGEVCIYLERFRGDDDLAARSARQFAAADQITDLVLGWAKSEFGRERGWKNLRRFLEVDFRRDLKNAALYLWAQQLTDLAATNAPGDFSTRFAQYLLERGYFAPSDLPQIRAAFNGEGDEILFRLLQRLTLSKLNLTPEAAAARKLPALADMAAFERSWEKYLAGTKLYRAQLQQWEAKKKLDAKLEKPEPRDALNGLMAEWMGESPGGGEADHLTVRLALDRAPVRSNGRWDNGQVVWKFDLDPDRALPALCYATWSRADAAFQQAHFGQVLLADAELMEYCYWQSALNEKQLAEWNQFLSGLRPGADLAEKIKGFQISTEPAAGSDEEKSPLAAGAKTLLTALESDSGAK